MIDFDSLKEKIRNMEYDSDRERYIGEDGSEFRIKMFKNGKGYKVDYYESTTYDDKEHNSIHIKSDLEGNWEAVENDRENDTQEHSSGSGCYLTTACMKHYLSNFDDNCYELTVLRWFRDNYVLREDVELYYKLAPNIVEKIDFDENKDMIYDYIYENIVNYCVKQIELGNYLGAYKRYKESILELNNFYTKVDVKQLSLKKNKHY